MLPISDDGPKDPGWPWMTWLLVAVNTGLFVSKGLDPHYPQLVEQWGFVPAHPTLQTALSSMFLHADWMHLAGNMWFLFVFGDNVELRLGPLTYLACYLLAGLGGDASHYAFFPHSPVPSIGASGAIFGIMGMYFYLFPFNRVKFLYFFFILIGTFRLAAVWAIGYFFLVESLYGYVSSQKHIETGVGHLAHAGGFLAGLVLANALCAFGVVKDDGRTLGSWLAGRRPRDEDEEA